VAAEVNEDNSAAHMLLTGLDWKYFNWHQMEFYGHLNFMKTALVY